MFFTHFAACINLAQAFDKFIYSEYIGERNCVVISQENNTLEIV